MSTFKVKQVDFPFPIPAKSFLTSGHVLHSLMWLIHYLDVFMEIPDGPVVETWNIRLILSLLSRVWIRFEPFRCRQERLIPGANRVMSWGQVMEHFFWLKCHILHRQSDDFCDFRWMLCEMMDFFAVKSHQTHQHTLEPEIWYSLKISRLFFLVNQDLCWSLKHATPSGVMINQHLG